MLTRHEERRLSSITLALRACVLGDRLVGSAYRMHFVELDPENTSSGCDRLLSDAASIQRWRQFAAVESGRRNLPAGQ
jgi:hypothetical protein